MSEENFSKEDLGGESRMLVEEGDPLIRKLLLESRERKSLLLAINVLLPKLAAKNVDIATVYARETLVNITNIRNGSNSGMEAALRKKATEFGINLDQAAQSNTLQ